MGHKFGPERSIEKTIKDFPRATRKPDKEVSATSARHSRL